MGYVRQTIEEMEAATDAMDALELQVMRVLAPFTGRQFSGDLISSRYLRLEGPGGNWGIKIRISDHSNTTNNSDYSEPDINLVTDCEYTDEQIWSKLRRAFWRNVS